MLADPVRIGEFLTELAGASERPATLSGLAGHRIAERAIADYCGRWKLSRSQPPQAPHAANA